MSWQAGVDGLRDKRTYALGGWQPGEAFEGLSDPPMPTKAKAAAVLQECYRQKRFMQGTDYL